ncbi:MAG: hypothetical protein D6715_07850 [Calditrichaeota bacterium]|nr:MAG: hypothetical protein D6715_07850 [Calditrichota bacterium]
MNPSRSEQLVEGVLQQIWQQGGHAYGEVSVGGARVVVLLDLVPEVSEGDRIFFQGKVALSRVSDEIR